MQICIFCSCSQQKWTTTEVWMSVCNGEQSFLLFPFLTILIQNTQQFKHSVFFVFCFCCIFEENNKYTNTREKITQGGLNVIHALLMPKIKDDIQWSVISEGGGGFKVRTNLKYWKLFNHCHAWTKWPPSSKLVKQEEAAKPMRFEKKCIGRLPTKPQMLPRNCFHWFSTKLKYFFLYIWLKMIFGRPQYLLLMWIICCVLWSIMLFIGPGLFVPTAKCDSGLWKGCFPRPICLFQFVSTFPVSLFEANIWKIKCFPAARFAEHILHGGFSDQCTCSSPPLVMSLLRYLQNKVQIKVAKHFNILWMESWAQRERGCGAAAGNYVCFYFFVIFLDFLVIFFGFLGDFFWISWNL